MNYVIVDGKMQKYQNETIFNNSVGFLSVFFCSFTLLSVRKFEWRNKMQFDLI